MLLIKNGYIMTMAGNDIDGGSILIDDNGKIVTIAKNIVAPQECKIIDAAGRLITPGCVEAHCHIGLRQPGLGWEGIEHNESTDPITPQMRAIDGINPDNEYFDNALKGGITCGAIGPGSANLIGGTFSVIKFAGKSIDEMILKPDCAMKCALGENPKSAYGQKKKAPKTRMGSAALMREFLSKAQSYQLSKDSGKEPTFDVKLESMLPVMRKEIPLKCHAHRTDDIFTSIRIAKEYNIQLTLDHCTEGSLIADVLAAESYPAIVGPFWGSRSKPELRHKNHATAGILHKAGVKVAITTDSPVIAIEKLTLCAGLAAIAGLPYREAWKAITINPAEILGIEENIGSLVPGKDADLVIWTDDPLKCICAEAFITIVNGKIVYSA